MEVHVAVAKVPKFGLQESGDTVEQVERPRGGVTLVMADGQTHGRAAKWISHLVAAKAAQLIADGVRDGAVARGVHDYLHAIRDGKVSAELIMVSVDVRTRSLVIARNTHVPVFLRLEDGRVERLDPYVEPIGVHAVMKPRITEVPLQPGLVVLAFTDGLFSAGGRYGRQWEPGELEAEVSSAQPHEMQALVERILNRAMAMDQNRPADDMSVMALGLGPGRPEQPVRRMTATVPL